MIRFKRDRFSALLLLVLIASSIASCAYRDTPIIEKERFLIGTIVEIKVPLPPGSSAKEIGSSIDRAFDEISRIEGVFSVYKSDSEVSKINRLKKDESVKISDETFGLIEKSIRYSAITDGAFDITVKPLIDIWAKARSDGKLPSADDIRSTRERVGSRYILLDRSAGTIAFKKDGMAIDLGGVAKGYATDRAIMILKEIGVKDAIVNSGGDLYCLGKRSAKKPWVVGIRHPRNKERMFLELQLGDKAVDTSGDYEKYFTIEGRRYSHIIDPATGYPVGDDVVSASVIADDSTTADILATALCVLGTEGMKIIDTGKGEDAVVVVKKDGAITSVATAGLMRRYNAKENEKL